MIEGWLGLITIFILSVFVGTNAIHGIVIVGAMLVAGLGHKDTLTTVVGLAAVVLASANVVGGFVVTDRMLEMFKGRGRSQPEERP
jgi:NAD(P) transhydrogenase subunit alpha